MPFPFNILKHCSSCKKSLYCSKTCQKQHWPEHKDKCTHLITNSGKDGLEFYDTLVKVKKGVFPVITIDVSNPTSHDIVLLRRTVIGTVQTIMTVLPAQICEKAQTPVAVNHTVAQTSCKSSEQWDPPVDLSHLEENQRQAVKQMPREECQSFSR